MMAIPEIRAKMEHASAGRLAAHNPTAVALLLSLDMLEKIATQPRHMATCVCVRCDTAREVDATLEAIKAEFL